MLSAAEMREEPEEERECSAEAEAGNDGEVQGGVFTAMNHVSGEAPQAEREFTAAVEQGSEEE